MSSTVSFNGTTIWSTASTGIGSVVAQRVNEATRWAIEPLPRANGSVAKNLGIDPGRYAVSLTYAMDSSALNTLQDALDAFAGVLGTLSLPPGQTHSNCILVGSDVVRGQAVKDESGGIVYFVRVNLTFERLKA